MVEGEDTTLIGKWARATGESKMIELDAAGGVLAVCAETPVSADEMFELGMIYSSGRGVPADLVVAHKWFNLAAMKGNAEAARLRREIAAEMLDAEIGQAQRAARDWLKAHPEAAAPDAQPLRAAA
jgi:TPR repeat protein